MKDFFIAMFSEDSKVSSQRLMSFLCVFAGIVLFVPNVHGAETYAGILIGSGLGSKVVSKFAEVKKQ
jgi:hypothetical protein